MSNVPSLDPKKKHLESSAILRVCHHLQVHAPVPCLIRPLHCHSSTVTVCLIYTRGVCALGRCQASMWLDVVAQGGADGLADEREASLPLERF